MGTAAQATAKVLAIVYHGRGDVGTAARLLGAAGYRLDIRCPMQGEALPGDARGYAGAIVFGGAMSAHDDHLDGIRASLAWLDGALEAGAPVLGICLGAQMIARLCGARVAPHEAGLWEIGYYPVTAAAGGATAFTDDRAQFYQWHGEGFDLPAGATLLASGTTFPNQAFAMGRSVYGLQFHPEVTADLFTTWMDASPGFEARHNAQPRARHFDGAARHGEAIQTWFGRFLAGWLEGTCERPGDHG
jgi:GMP synthase (glutamine-hydrolysing)